MQGPESRQPGDHFFHYRREEREQGLKDDVRNRQRLGFFARNRHLTLIFVDILIICLVFLFLFPYIRMERRSIAGYRADLSVTQFDRTILVALKFSPESSEEGEEELETRELEVILEVLPDGRRSRLYGILTPGESTVLRARIPLRAGDQLVEARLAAAGEELILRSEIPDE